MGSNRLVVVVLVHDWCTGDSGKRDYWQSFLDSLDEAAGKGTFVTTRVLVDASNRGAGIVARAGGPTVAAAGLEPGQSSPGSRTAMKASCGMVTEPTIFMRFVPSFCFSSSFRLRVTSPP